MVEHIMKAVLGITDRVMVLNVGNEDRGRPSQGSNEESVGHRGVLRKVIMMLRDRENKCLLCRSSGSLGSFPQGRRKEIVALIGPNGAGKTTSSQDDHWVVETLCRRD